MVLVCNTMINEDIQYNLNCKKWLGNNIIVLKKHKYLIILLCKVSICLHSSHAYKLRKISNFPLAIKCHSENNRNRVDHGIMLINLPNTSALM